MTRRVYIYFILTFLLGLTLGGAGTFFFTWYTGHWHMRFDPQRIVDHMRRDLKLSDNQVQQLRQIMDETDAKFKELRKQSSPAFDNIRHEMRDRIRRILTPEQIVKFDEIVRRHEAREKGRMGPPPPPPPE
jgi:Spy/CpxP family protein refolding chaperone